MPSPIEYISFLNRCVTVRDITNLNDGKDVRIRSCEDSYLYIGNFVESLSVSKCVNCTVFVSAVARVCTLDRCENVTICCATSYLRIGNCVDCTVYSYTHMSPPVVFGDTRSLMLAPHNASYPDLQAQLKEAGINWKNQKTSPDSSVEERIGFFSKPILMRVSKQSISL
jgi:hypothetical protein